MKNKNSKCKINIKQRVYLYVLEIIKFIDALNKKDFAVEIIAKQLLRSTTSVGANLIEAQAGRSKKDFTNFLTHSLKSANETKFWLAILRDSKKSNIIDNKKLFQETKEIANILAASIITLKRKSSLNNFNF